MITEKRGIFALHKERILLLPRISEEVFIAPGAQIIGDVRIGKNSSIWYGAVIRADVNWVEIGEGVNIQDCSIVHVETASFPTVVGNMVTIGHRATIHGCIIKDYSLVGIGAIVMNGAEVGPFSIVGAGAVVPEGSKIPPGTLAVGVPARVKRELNDKEIDMLRMSAEKYIMLAKWHSNKITNLQEIEMKT